MAKAKSDAVAFITTRAQAPKYHRSWLETQSDALKPHLLAIREAFRSGEMRGTKIIEIWRQMQGAEWREQFGENPRGSETGFRNFLREPTT